MDELEETTAAYDAMEEQRELSTALRNTSSMQDAAHLVLPRLLGNTEKQSESVRQHHRRVHLAVLHPFYMAHIDNLISRAFAEPLLLQDFPPKVEALRARVGRSMSFDLFARVTSQDSLDQCISHVLVDMPPTPDADGQAGMPAGEATELQPFFVNLKGIEVIGATAVADDSQDKLLQLRRRYTRNKELPSGKFAEQMEEVIQIFDRGLEDAAEDDDDRFSSQIQLTRDVTTPPRGTRDHHHEEAHHGHVQFSDHHSHHGDRGAPDGHDHQDGQKREPWIVAEDSYHVHRPPGSADRSIAEEFLEIPIEPVETVRLGFFFGDLALNGLAEMNAEHFRKKSAADTSLSVSMIPAQLFRGFNDQQMEDMDLGIFRTYNHPDAKAGVDDISPPTANFVVAADDLERLERTMAVVANQPTTSQATGRELATVRLMNEAQSMSRSQAWLQSWLGAYTRAWRWASLYMGIPWPEDAMVSVTENVMQALKEQPSFELLLQMYEAGALDDQTIVEEAQRYAVLSGRPDVADILSRMAEMRQRPLDAATTVGLRGSA